MTAAAGDRQQTAATMRATGRRTAARVDGWSLAAWATALIVVVPIGALASSVLSPSTDVWRQQWATRLPSQLIDTALLLVMVGAGSLLLGCGLAWLTGAHRFPGSRWLGPALVAPLALPSYTLGFLTLSVIGPTGPIQDWWRATFGRDAWFPDVMSVWGAALTFTLVLFPYVYLLARAALSDSAGAAYEAARSLGASPTHAARRVVLPMLRPAIAGGAAVVMMETLTDFATVQYFGVDTVSVGVFRIWRGTFDRDAASEFATLVLVIAFMVMAIERGLRGRARFAGTGGSTAGIRRRELTGLRGWSATAVCVGVLGVSFAGPAVQLVAWAVAEQGRGRTTLGGERFLGFLEHSVILAVLTAAICVVVGVVVTNARRFSRHPSTRVAASLAGAGYAVPGPVVAIGIVLTLAGVDAGLERIGLDVPGFVATGSLLTLVAAYCVRFLAPGMNALDGGLSQVSAAMTASARSLGRSPRSVVRRVHLPLTRSSVATAAVLVAIDAIKELPIALLLRPFGFDTLSVWTYSLASESRFEQAALPALAIIVLALVPVTRLARSLDDPNDRTST